MDDLISRKALLAEYDRVHVGEPGGARKLIEDAPAVQRWIPVSERLPERGTLVICVGQRGGMFIGTPEFFIKSVFIHSVGLYMDSRPFMYDGSISQQQSGFSR